jgi:hypothetical protein
MRFALIPALLLAPALAALDTVTVQTVTPVIEESSPSAQVVARLVRTGSSGDLAVSITAGVTTGYALSANGTPVVFTAGTATVTIPNGAASVDLLMDPSDDDVVEGATSILLSVASSPVVPPSPPTYVVGGSFFSSIIIADDDLLLSWGIVDGSSEEDFSGALPDEATFSTSFRTRSGVSPTSFGRNVVLQPVTSAEAGPGRPLAAFATDYLATVMYRHPDQGVGTTMQQMRSAVFLPGDGWVGIRTLTGDTAKEGTSVVKVTKLSDSEFNGSILSKGSFRLTVGDVIQFDEDRSQLHQILSITATGGGSATAPAEVWQISVTPALRRDIDEGALIRNNLGMLISADGSIESRGIPSGYTALEWTITPLVDTDVEGAERYRWRFIDTNDIALETPQEVEGLIGDDDLLVDIRLGQDAGRPDSPGYAVVRLSTAVEQSVEVPFAIISSGVGAAVEGTDFQAIARSVVVPAGTRESRIQITPAGSGTTTQRVTLQLSDTQDFLLAGLEDGFYGSTATVNILPLSGEVSVTTVTAAGREGGTPTNPVFRISVARSPGFTGPIGVAYGLSGTATASEDYESLTGLATIPGGSDSVDVTVVVRDDAVAEPSETVVLALQPSAGYVIDTLLDDATATIADDEPTISVVAGPAVDEDQATGTTFTLTYTGPALAGTLDVAYRLGGTASVVVDYAVSGVSGTASFVGLGGGLVNPVVVRITPVVDGLVEGPETVTLRVLSGTTYSAASASSASIIINDIDSAPAPGKPPTGSGSGGSGGCGLGSGLAALLGALAMALRLGLRRRR